MFFEVHSSSPITPAKKSRWFIVPVTCRGSARMLKHIIPTYLQMYMHLPEPGPSSQNDKIHHKIESGSVVPTCMTANKSQVGASTPFLSPLCMKPWVPGIPLYRTSCSIVHANSETCMAICQACIPVASILESPNPPPSTPASNLSRFACFSASSRKHPPSAP